MAGWKVSWFAVPLRMPHFLDWTETLPVNLIQAGNTFPPKLTDRSANKQNISFLRVSEVKDGKQKEHLSKSILHHLPLKIVSISLCLSCSVCYGSLSISLCLSSLVFNGEFSWVTSLWLRVHSVGTCSLLFSRDTLYIHLNTNTATQGLSLGFLKNSWSVSAHTLPLKTSAFTLASFWALHHSTVHPTISSQMFEAATFEKAFRFFITFGRGEASIRRMHIIQVLASLM